jgi:hypothetical protein
MNNAGYWKDHPVYISHELLAEKKHGSGDWEMFVVDYKPGHQLYHGGKFVEFYWNGDYQESFDFENNSDHRKQLEMFIDFWLDGESGTGAEN